MPRTDAERINILEHNVKDQERRITAQESKNDSLTEIAMYVNLQIDRNKKHDKQFKELTKALQGINANLIGLNKDVKSVKADVGNVMERVDTLEGEKLLELQGFKRVCTDTYLKIVSGVALALILLWLGLK